MLLEVLLTKRFIYGPCVGKSTAIRMVVSALETYGCQVENLQKMDSNERKRFVLITLPNHNRRVILADEDELMAVFTMNFFSEWWKWQRDSPEKRALLWNLAWDQFGVLHKALEQITNCNIDVVVFGSGSSVFKKNATIPKSLNHDEFVRRMEQRDHGSSAKRWVKEYQQWGIPIADTDYLSPLFVLSTILPYSLRNKLKVACGMNNIPEFTTQKHADSFALLLNDALRVLFNP